ncbi:MAG: alcohol dehydrogenase [Chloroflexi bacterium]|nr:MAG: alcohol dehydrogenase [Chloroflexota bacterium]
MRALWLQDRQLRLRDDVPMPEPAAGEALVRVLCAGICSTDLELVRGYYPYSGVLGHEFVGVVESGPAHMCGRRVVGEINASCGACDQCARGQPTHCLQRTVLGILQRAGCFAQYLTLPAANLHIVPDEVSTTAATFTEPLAAALEIEAQVPLALRQRVLVVGAGRLGHLIAQTLALTGCELWVAGRAPAQLAWLAARGLNVCAAADAEPHAFDMAVECTGNAQGFALALRALRPRGTLVLKSTYAGSLTLDAAPIVVNELTVVGSRCGPFAPALQLLAAGRVLVEPLVHARYALADGMAAFAHAAQPAVLKVLLDTGA